MGSGGVQDVPHLLPHTSSFHNSTLNNGTFSSHSKSSGDFGNNTLSYSTFRSLRSSSSSSSRQDVEHTTHTLRVDWTGPSTRKPASKSNLTMLPSRARSRKPVVDTIATTTRFSGL